MQHFNFRLIAIFVSCFALVCMIGCQEQNLEEPNPADKEETLLDLNFVLDPQKEQSFGLRLPFQMKGNSYLFDFSLKRNDGAAEGFLKIVKSGNESDLPRNEELPQESSN